jgi:hypothetical protein
VSLAFSDSLAQRGLCITFAEWGFDDILPPSLSQFNREVSSPMTSKVEVAFRMLSKQGHRAQAVVRGSGAVWFDIDGCLRVSWQQMSDFADGPHRFES